MEGASRGFHSRSMLKAFCEGDEDKDVKADAKLSLNIWKHRLNVV